MPECWNGIQCSLRTSSLGVQIPLPVPNGSLVQWKYARLLTAERLFDFSQDPPICSCGGIGIHVGLRSPCISMWVQVSPRAPMWRVVIIGSWAVLKTVVSKGIQGSSPWLSAKSNYSTYLLNTSNGQTKKNSRWNRFYRFRLGVANIWL